MIAHIVYLSLITSLAGGLFYFGSKYSKLKSDNSLLTKENADSRHALFLMKKLISREHVLAKEYREKIDSASTADDFNKLYKEILSQTTSSSTA